MNCIPLLGSANAGNLDAEVLGINLSQIPLPEILLLTHCTVQIDSPDAESSVSTFATILKKPWCFPEWCILGWCEPPCGGKCPYKEKCIKITSVFFKTIV